MSKHNSFQVNYYIDSADLLFVKLCMASASPEPLLTLLSLLLKIPAPNSEYNQLVRR